MYFPLKKQLLKIIGPKGVNYLIYLRDKRYTKQIIYEGQNSKKALHRYMPKKIAIIFIGTNAYAHFFPNWYDSIEKFFLPNTPKHYFVFTNTVHLPFFKKKNITVAKIKHKKFPYCTLMRYSFIIKKKNLLSKYPYIIYLDSDMQVMQTITEEEFFTHNKPFFQSGIRISSILGKKDLSKQIRFQQLMSQWTKTQISIGKAVFGAVSKSRFSK